MRGDYEVGEEWGCVWRGEGEVRGEWVFVDDGGGDDDCLYVMSDLWLFLVVSMFADYIYIYIYTHNVKRNEKGKEKKKLSYVHTRVAITLG